MYRKDFDEFKPPAVPPAIHSPPPMALTSSENNTSYRWTSKTAAYADKTSVDSSMQTPDKKKADASWLSPSKGDTWRLNVPRGKIREMAAIFDSNASCTRDELIDKTKYRHQNQRHRRNSEPNQENEDRLVPEPNFFDDSMMEDQADNRDDNEIYESFFAREDGIWNDQDQNARSFSTVDMPSQHDLYIQNSASYRNYPSSGRDSRRNDHNVHRTTVECTIGDGGDGAEPNVRVSSFIDLTSNQNNATMQNITLHNGDAETVSASTAVGMVNNFVTSTPRNPRVHEEMANYFGGEASIRRDPFGELNENRERVIRRGSQSPLSRRERRRTQVIMHQSPSFPVSQTALSSPSPSRRVDCSRQSSTKEHDTVSKRYDFESNMGCVRNVAGNFEQSDHGLHRKIDAAAEIAELRRRAAAQNGKPPRECYDENANLVSDYSTQVIMRPKMGISSMTSMDFKCVNMYEAKSDKNGAHIFCYENIKERSKSSAEDLYAVPLKGSSLDQDEADEPRYRNRSPPRVTKQQMMRQSLPFSDIPEERTYDKIDEMFDFVEKTADFEKSMEDVVYGYATVDSGKSKGEREPRKMNLKECGKANASNNTYQELDLSTTRHETEAEGTGYTMTSGASGAPRYTWSPILVTPHAGQSVTEYRVSEKEGLPTTAEKIVIEKSMTPAALATSTPIGTVAARQRRCNMDDSFVSSISTMSTADNKMDSRRQIVRLIENIEKTRKHVHLAEIALIDAKKGRLIMQELSAQRVLLVCRQRLDLQLDEVKRLQAMSVVRHPPPPVNRHFKSSMVISNVFVMLNKNFCQRGSFAFVVLLKCRTEVEATGVVTLLAHYQTRLNQIHFGEHLHFSNLPVDFVITMEVYMMRVPEHKPPEKTCAALLVSKCKNLLVPNSAQRKLKPSKARGTSFMSTYETPNCDFAFCGRLTLDRDSVGDRHFYLDDISYPLEGTVKLVSHCSSLPEAIDVEYRGYLTMYQETSPNGTISWERYWAMLNRGVIFFWRHPTDESSDKCPLAQIDLTKCTNQSIEPSSSETSARQNMFSIELLIDQTPALLEKRRVLLATDSTDLLHSWLTAINETLAVLRS